jgi:hypothetical protein
MKGRKVLLPLLRDLLEAARAYASEGDLSAYVVDGLRRRVLSDRLARYLRELDVECGPLTERASVLANWPTAWAKRRTWPGLTTATGTAAATKAATSPTSRPPVASSTTRVGRSPTRRPTKAAMPGSACRARYCSPLGRTAISRWALATSIPTKLGLSMGFSCGGTRGPSLHHAGSAAQGEAGGMPGQRSEALQRRAPPSGARVRGPRRRRNGRCVPDSAAIACVGAAARSIC